jgi:hypothetical protein
MTTGGDSLVCFSVQLAQSVWAELISRFLKEEKPIYLLVNNYMTEGKVFNLHLSLEQLGLSC